ncbi:CBO0543 family protein [Halalkalibacter urbisdiaboli]|uniref:CBO0543 family protein n=1 Tax=Halalkalibacter urbisdiaboli TaxID=1960589 RepID=UPI000B42DCE3|nr:CBO0543 family protein [Halalkalibacter urbisdiaboli]
MFIKQKVFHQINESYQLLHKAQNIKAEVWMESILFTPQWWVGVGLTIIPWLIWFKLHHRQKRYRLLFVGFYVSMISSFLDFLGVQLGLWRYYYDVFPWLPAYVPWDWTLIPVLVMSLIEIRPQVSPIKKAVIFALLATAFEPIFSFFHFYKAINWAIIYSIPIYIVIYLTSHKLSRVSGFQHISQHD